MFENAAKYNLDNLLYYLHNQQPSNLISKELIIFIQLCHTFYIANQPLQTALNAWNITRKIITNSNQTQNNSSFSYIFYCFLFPLDVILFNLATNKFMTECLFVYIF